MGNAWKSKPLKEVMRENKRMITRAIRELDREKTGLEREEKRLTMEIKKAARENQMSSVKVMAKVSVVFVFFRLLLVVVRGQQVTPNVILSVSSVPSKNYSSPLI